MDLSKSKPVLITGFITPLLSFNKRFTNRNKGVSYNLYTTILTSLICSVKEML